MNDRNQLIAYLSTLGALVTVVVVALAFGAFSQHVIDKIEAFGIGTVTGGLIGVLRIPQRSGQVTVGKADQVGPNGPDTAA